MAHIHDTLDAIQRSPGVVLVIGGSDSGKTSWVKATAGELGKMTRDPVAIVDGDIGHHPHRAACDRRPWAPSRSVPSATPDRPSLRGLELYRVCDAGQTLSSTPDRPETPRGSSERGTCATLFVDTMGLIAPGIGFQLTLRTIKLLDPRHLVTSEHHAELETLIMVARRRPGLEILLPALQSGHYRWWR
jgi:hypothetical protein